MGFWDIFKGNSKKRDDGKSSLELLLLECKQLGTFSAEFYRQVLSEDLIIITYNSESQEGQHDLHQQSSVNIVTYPEGQIPVFTSVDRIYDKGVINEQVQYILMKGSDLFAMAKDATFIMNPYSDTCKEFLPEEVRKMLTQSETKNGLYMEKVSDIQIGQPHNYPNEMLKNLSDFFSTRKEVLSAYIGWIFNPKANKEPHYIIGIKANDDSKTLVAAACDIAMEALPQNEAVDIVVLNRRSIISDYLIHKTKPFYQRPVQII
jgi:hypothetical protein